MSRRLTCDDTHPSPPLVTAESQHTNGQCTPATPATAAQIDSLVRELAELRVQVAKPSWHQAQQQHRDGGPTHNRPNPNSNPNPNPTTHHHPGQSQWQAPKQFPVPGPSGPSQDSRVDPRSSSHPHHSAPRAQVVTTTSSSNPFTPPVVAAGRRVAFEDDAAQLRPPVQRAPPIRHPRALDPYDGLDLDPADIHLDIPDRIAKKMLSLRTSVSLYDIYAIGNDKLRTAVQKSFNEMHTRVETAPQAPRAAVVSAAASGSKAPRPVQVNLVPHASAPVEPLLEMDAVINNMVCVVTLDTGAQVNVMCLAALTTLRLTLDTDAAVGFRGVDGVQQRALGTTTCNVRLGKSPTGSTVSHQTFIVLDDKDNLGYTILLGLPFLRSVGGTVDLASNRFTVRLDGNTTTSYPLKSAVHHAQQPAEVRMITTDHLGCIPSDYVEDPSGEVSWDDEAELAATLRRREALEMVPSDAVSFDYLETDDSDDPHMPDYLEPFPDPYPCVQPTLLDDPDYPLPTTSPTLSLSDYLPYPLSTPISDYEDSADDDSRDSSDDDGSATLDATPDPPDYVPGPTVARLHLQDSSLQPLPETEVELMSIDGFPKPISVGIPTPAFARTHLASLLLEHRDAFAFSMDDLSQPAALPAHTISLVPGAQPIATKARRLPPVEEQLISDMIQDQLKHGLIRPSNSPWRSQPLVIPKKEEPGVDSSSLPMEDRLRAVIDFRKLNSLTVDDRYPMPITHEVVEAAAAGRLYTRLDVKSAFYQIELHEDSRQYTAFATREGLFEYNRMPMGLKNSPATWVRGIQQLLLGLPYVKTYFDDLVVATEGAQPAVEAPMLYVTHLAQVKAVLQRLEAANVRCTLHKCVFCAVSTRFTGFILRDGTISTDPDKTRAVDALDPSKGPKELASFLGFISYYGRFHIYHFSSVTKILRDLARHDAVWHWTAAHTEAVERLKHMVKHSLVRYAPDWNKPFILATDFSKDGLAAILSQAGDDDIEYPIGFASRATTSQEQVMGAYAGELAAVQYGVKVFHYYLYGRRFLLLTDHEALKYLYQQEGSNTRLGRLAAVLRSEYEFDIQYKKGRLNANVDALSRYPAHPGVPEQSLWNDNVLTNLPTPPSLPAVGVTHPLPFVGMLRFVVEQPNATASDVEGEEEEPHALPGTPAPSLAQLSSGPFGALSPRSTARRSAPESQTTSPTTPPPPSSLPTALRPPADQYPLPRLDAPSAGNDDDPPVDATAACAICGNAQDDQALIVCESCDCVYHSYCLEDALPDGLVPTGPFHCSKCLPFDIEEQPRPARKYLDIWEDQETLRILMLGDTTTSSRAAVRAQHYRWDAGRKLLLTHKGNRIVPHPDDRQALALAAHATLGHRGFRSVSDALRLHYTWKGLREDVQAAVQGCAGCAQKPLTFKASRDPTLHPIPPSNLFMKWTIDLVGPLTPAEGTGHKHVAVAVDSYSKLVVATGISDKTSKSVATWFERNIIFQYGAPLEVQCDRGGEFMKHFHDLCTKYSIYLARGSAYHPQTQGLVERANRTLKAALAAYGGEEPDGWEQHLHKAVFSMNATKQASTRYTPYFLAHGIEARLPLDLQSAEQLGADMGADADGSVEGDVSKRAQALNAANSSVVKNVRKAQDQQAEGYAKRMKGAPPSPTLKIGDRVYQADRRGIKPGQPPRAAGPFEVAGFPSKGKVMLVDAAGQKWSTSLDKLMIKDTGAAGPSGAAK